MTTILVMNLASSTLLTLLALPLLFGKVPPNPFYGFRIAPALDDPAVWYPTNRHAAARLIATGVSTAIAAIGLWLVPGITIDVYALGCLGVFAVVFGVGTVQSYRFMRAVAKGKPSS